MLHKQISACVCTAFALAAVGCNIARVEVQVEPRDVRMERVTIDGNQAKENGTGRYEQDVHLKQGEDTRDIRVVAKAAGGVIVEKGLQVTKGQLSSETLKIPAELEIKIAPPATRVRLTLDGEPREISGKPIEVPAGKPVVVQATAQDTNVVAQQQIVVPAGERRQVQLEPVREARFSVSRTAVSYGDQIDFDASASAPAGTITSYIWNFGDGPPVETKEPRTWHTYQFDPGKSPEEQEFRAALQVKTLDGETSQPKVTPLKVKLTIKKLALSIDMYPQNQSFRPGEAVQFKLLVQDAQTAKLAEDLTLAFGDGCTTADAGGTPIRLVCEEGRCRPIIVSHAYTSARRFVPQLTYRLATRRAETQTAELQMRDGSPPAVVVAPAYLSDRDLKDKAWEDFYRQFKDVLHDAGVNGKRLALTSFTSANFEYDEPQFVSVIQRLTKLLVAENYYVLEKTSPVLARLAPEAVVDIRPELAGGVAVAEQLEPVYRDQLEYGLAAYHSPEKPIFYSLRMAGTEDRVSLFHASSANVAGEGVTVNPNAIVRAPEVTEREGHLTTLEQQLPFLVARFKTAQSLIALKVVDEERVKTTGPVVYSEEFEEALYERTASVKVHVRVLERTGRILRAVDIAGSCSELVPESALASFAAK